MVTDPICGMAVNEQSAAGSLRDAGTDYFFCSTDCLNQFAARIESLVRLKRVSVQIGTISEALGPVVEIVCDRLPPLHQVLYASIDHEAYTFEAHQHLDEKRVRAVALNRTSGLKRAAACR